MAEFDPNKSDFRTVEEMMDTIKEKSNENGMTVEEATKEYTQFDSWKDAKDAYYA